MEKHVLLFIAEEKIFFITKIERAEIPYKSLVFPDTEDINSIQESIEKNCPRLVIIDSKFPSEKMERIIAVVKQAKENIENDMNICIKGSRMYEIPGVHICEDMEEVRDLIKIL